MTYPATNCTSYTQVWGTKRKARATLPPRHHPPADEIRHAEAQNGTIYTSPNCGMAAHHPVAGASVLTAQQACVGRGWGRDWWCKNRYAATDPPAQEATTGSGDKILCDGEKNDKTGHRTWRPLQLCHENLHG